jgi:hypothetical protein
VSPADLESLLVVAFGFAVGGFLKGATGAGAPLLAVPLLSLYFDVRFAVVIFSIPNLVPNLWQAWTYRRTALPRPFLLRFAFAGMLGAGIGTWILATVPPEKLMLSVAAAVALYIAFKLARPNWRLDYAHGLRLAVPVGTLAGILQGASGVSAPVSLTFLNSLGLERSQFVPTVSMFFVGLGVVQIPMLIGYGMLTPRLALWSAAALVPLIAAMPLGAKIGRHVSREVFDRIILALLAALAIKLVVEAI